MFCVKKMKNALILLNMDRGPFQTYPSAKKITLVCDNLNTHGPGSWCKAFPPEEAGRLMDKFEIVHIPKHGSWLDVAEIELSVLSRQCLGRRLDSMAKIETEASAWCGRRNACHAKVDWQFTARDARIKLKHLYPVFTCYLADSVLTASPDSAQSVPGIPTARCR